MTPSAQVYLVTGVTDMRKSIDGLSLIVAQHLEMDPFSESWFIFCNRHRDKLKILFWDTNGFWLYYRRLEKGTFKWPKPTHDGALHISKAQLNWLLSGLSIEHHRAHRPITNLTV
ncbi:MULTISPECIES: IS66 family insertion sequence element accessory protein TnpB [Shewanella]|jgi:transposase|uniref:IS66 Orf2 family protein n=1 Tax=Shewanella baltica (strain OS195) TaxID=399599 RepID=A9L088_SHEB9|nr:MULTISPECIES: IS66 family insertion sequence element accessory protein TnpB [Shewanella]ABS06772.1 IS66 Orf2 family protein [Shewanella baltica OS185]ABX47817.1 IS66 Orf2 family protein [Shewanella baltica OS195]ADT92839.1 IS66 Orf2 family protein [Shewanella baltica OS678]MCL1160217.1 IS66 family insertion sequence element accessory protein TnpB [Shewanella inventionis]MCS6130030.1 IS66 family insertion sequence element accessory protein TnpB [Shewanella baltica]|tara:strand:+ start:2450 stop:2794 length:345 start_codon:yes stop_codon:yes gene_type:complete